MVAHEERVDFFRHDLAHALRPRRPSVGINGDVGLVQHTHLDVLHILHLLADPLLALFPRDDGQMIGGAQRLGLHAVVGDDDDQLVTLRGCGDHLVEMTAMGRQKPPKVNAGSIHGAAPPIVLSKCILYIIRAQDAGFLLEVFRGV